MCGEDVALPTGLHDLAWLSRYCLQLPAPMTPPPSEHLLQRFAAETKDMIFRCRISPSRAWEYLSPSCLRLTGYTVEEHFADPMLVFKVVHPEDVLVYEGLIRDPDRAERPFTVRWIRKDGTQLWIEEHVRFVRDEKGTTIAVEGIARDVTERKRIEAQLAEAQRIAQIGSWEWVADRDELTWSDEHCRIFGIETGAAPKTEAGFLAAVAPEDRERVTDIVRRGMEDHLPYRFDYRIVRPDGEVRILHSRGQVFADQTGRVVRVAGTAQDITERRHLEARLLVADRIGSLGLLAGGIAHEINNPLTFMSGSIDLLSQELERKGGDTPESTADLLQNLRHGCERITRIVRDLRLYARGDEDKVGPVDLKRVMNQAAELTRNEVRHRANMVIDLAGVPLIAGNEFRLGQVFVNLIVNAAQAIRDGAVAENEIRIKGGTSTDGRVFVEVRDTGAGIPASVRHRIFDPFFTTKPIGAGTGLGLAICHTLVSSMGGEIQVESEVGKGSTFRVLLKGNVNDEAVSPASPVLESHDRGRLLIVDDEARVAWTLARLLESHQLTVSTANGRDALERITAGHRFDAILCDVMMPDVSGIDLHDHLMRSAPDQAKRMIFMTGGAFVDRAKEFLERIPNPRLEKPFDITEARAAIAQVFATQTSSVPA
jgi:two-component system, cell cycle sensor histidine kinase and response regulator CckA